MHFKPYDPPPDLLEAPLRRRSERQIMTTAQKNEEIVDACIARIKRNRPPEQLVQAFDDLVGSLWLRSSRTLSEVTLDAIFERCLYISKERFPLLSSLKVNHKERRIHGLIRHSPGADMSQMPEMIAAFRYFLVTLLTLLGNLTADVLLSGLYWELQTFGAQPLKAGSPAVGLTSNKDQIQLKDKKA